MVRNRLPLPFSRDCDGNREKKKKFDTQAKNLAQPKISVVIAYYQRKCLLLVIVPGTKIVAVVEC